MAGASRHTALLDANVLFPKLQCDALISLAQAGLYAAKWSPHIEQEWLISRLAKFPGSNEANRNKARAMTEAIPDCMVYGYEKFIDCLDLPDPDDRHVLAAAIVGHADAIVTNNLKDFPLERLEPHCIEVQTPDQFIVNQLTLHQARAVAALRAMRERWNNPAPHARIDGRPVRETRDAADGGAPRELPQRGLNPFAGFVEKLRRAAPDPAQDLIDVPRILTAEIFKSKRICCIEVAAELNPILRSKRAVDLEDLVRSGLDVCRVLHRHVEVGIPPLKIFFFCIKLDRTVEVPETVGCEIELGVQVASGKVALSRDLDPNLFRLHFQGLERLDAFPLAPFDV